MRPRQRYVDCWTFPNDVTFGVFQSFPGGCTISIWRRGISIHYPFVNQNCVELVYLVGSPSIAVHSAPQVEDCGLSTSLASNQATHSS
jgi:hypothetical protein